MGFYKQNGVANLSGFITFFETNLAAEGWTVTTMNANPALPPDLCLGRELVAKAPGSGSGDPAVHAIGMTLLDPFSGALKIYFYAAQAIKGPVDIDTVTYSGTTATINTVNPHPFVTGDLVYINGTDIPAFNRTAGGSVDTPNTITSTGANSFTVVMTDGGGVGTANGGKAVALYNMCGVRTTTFNIASSLLLSDAPMDIYAWIDEHALSAIIVQGGGYFNLHMGRPGRKHIHASARGAALLTAQVVSDGATPVTLDLDRDLSGKIYTGAWMQLYNPDDATPNSIDQTRTSSTQFQVTVLSGTQLQAVIPAGTWKIGALIGLDAAPVISGCGDSATSVQATPLYASQDAAGVASNNRSVDMRGRIVSAVNEETNNDPNGAGFLHKNPISLTHSAGYREWLTGTYGVARTVQNDEDIGRGGAPSEDPTPNVIMFPSKDIDGWVLAIGPEATASA